jgi:hypothetical protein
MFDGIALVSHKLKMLSFLFACNDSSSEDINYLSLWLYSEYVKRWKRWSKMFDDSHEVELFFPNVVHAKYNAIFELSIHDNVYAYEVCLNVEDHYKNDLFYEKIVHDQDVEGLEDSIYAFNDAIEDMKAKIEKLTSQIEKTHDSLKNYEVQLYTSRVESELFA